MDTAEIQRISAWTVERGLAGDDESALLQGFCARCAAAGLAITRATAIIDTLHPVYAGRAFSWNHDKPLDAAVSEYGPLVEGSSLSMESWTRSPFYRLLYGGADELRLRLELGETGDFPILEELRKDGQTDYFALVQRFDKEASIGEIDCFMSRWTTTRPGGFDPDDIDALRWLVPVLGLAIKSASLARVAQALVEAYLGKDAGRRVLQGKMVRGEAERINAVIWFSDMQDYTGLSEQIDSDQIIPLLNDYSEVAIAAVQDAGGDVLKLMADGVLAIFTADDSAVACSAACRAEADMRLKLAALNQRRTAAGQPVSSLYLGLHVGDVFYGNIGSKDRLDFTVVGPAVNEASRISSMCRSVGREVLFSSAFHAVLPAQDRSKLVSVGRYALRGVSGAQELFTVDPGIAAQQRPV